MKAGKTAADYRAKPIVHTPTTEYVAYPRAVKNADGTTVHVESHEHEEAVTGVKMNPDGTAAEVVAAPIDVSPEASSLGGVMGSKGSSSAPTEPPMEPKPVEAVEVNE